MASNYTVNTGIEQPDTGDKTGTWGLTLNTNFDLIDEATNGVVTITLADTGSSGSPNDLPISNGQLSNGRNVFIEFVDTGDLGGTVYVQLTPNDAEKVCYVRNSLSGSRSILLFQGTYNASNDYELVAGADAVVKFSGTGAAATVTDVFKNLTATAITATTYNNLPVASTTTSGIVELATQAEVDAGTDTARAVTPATLKAVSNLDSLTDVTITAVSNNELLQYNTGSALWVNRTFSEAGVAPVASPVFTGNPDFSACTIPDLGTVTDVNFTSLSIGGVPVTATAAEINYLDISVLGRAEASKAVTADASGVVDFDSLSSVNVNIDSGAIDGTPVGSSSPSSVKATTLTVTKEIVENVYTLTGTTPALDPGNGTIQTWTLTAASTPTDSLVSGESMTLHVTAGAYTITWPTMKWMGGDEPTLDTSYLTVIQLWKVGSTLYGALVGVTTS